MQSVLELAAQLQESQATPQPNMQRVADFVKLHPYVFPALETSIPEIKRFFPDAALSLEVVGDPDLIDDVHLYVYISISPNLTPMDALDQLKEFRRVWGHTAVQQARGKIAFTIRY